MKKRDNIKLFIILVLGLILFSILVSVIIAQEDGQGAAEKAAQEAARKAAEEAAKGISEGQLGQLEETGGKIEKATETVESLSDTGRSEYLKQEWKKILGKSKFGEIVLSISNFIGKLNPFFKAVLGVEYSLSWLFVFAVMIWIILFVIIYPILDSLINKKLISFIASFAVVSLVGLSGVIRKAVELLSFALKNKWLVWASFAITIIIVIVIIAFGGGLKKIIQKEKEEAAKRKTEQEREIISTSAEIEKKKLEGYKNGGGI